ncbi:MAG: type II secretion system F family protein [Arenicella sp.]|nr:type II secretion system F family protein [Arenicella sp.]
MTAFTCKTRNASGDVVEKTINALSTQEAMAMLEDSGLFPIQIRPVDAQPAGNASKKYAPSQNQSTLDSGSSKRKKYRVPRKEVMQFSLQLSSSLEAGVPILDGIRSSMELTRNIQFQQVLSQISVSIQNGNLMSEAMSDFPAVFSEAYVGAIAAGEQSGTLEDMLDNLAEFLEADMEMRSDLRSAIMYPAIVVGTLVLAVVVLVVFVVPRFTAFYSGFGSELPLATRMLMASSSFVGNHYIILLGLIVGISFAVKGAFKVRAVRVARDRVILRLPVFGSLVETAITLQVVQLIGLFTKAGLPLLEAVQCAASTSGNLQYKDNLQSIAAGIAAGETLAAGMAAVQCFPLEARHMLVNGETTGTMERACASTAKRYKKELRYKTKILSTLIEPMLTLVLAMIVLFIALAVFLPMWDLVSVVGDGS